ncbi:MAG: Lpp/OprI family alanine-zipper lipoprotein [Pseudomonadota bacterium]
MKGITDMRAGLLVLAVLATGLSGCATTSDLNNLKAQVDAANATANEAKADAAAARREAADAKALAGQAMSTANDAKASADASQAKIDRMFKKAMYK